MFYLQSSKHYICIVFQDKKKKKKDSETNYFKD